MTRLIHGACLLIALVGTTAEADFVVYRIPNTTLAVVLQAVMAGGLPWVSLVLAFSFAGYGYVRKVTPVNRGSSTLTAGFGGPAESVAHEASWGPAFIDRFVYSASNDKRDYELYIDQASAIATAPGADGGPLDRRVGVALDANVRKLVSQGVTPRPVGGRSATVQEARTRQQEGTRAHGTDAPARSSRPLEPGVEGVRG